MTQVVDPVEFLVEAARTSFAAFVSAVHRPRYKHSAFSAAVCRAIDQFVEDLIAGKRPVLMLTAPSQHGKSSLISRCLPPYLMGRLLRELPGVRLHLHGHAHDSGGGWERRGDRLVVNGARSLVAVEWDPRTVSAGEPRVVTRF